MGRPRTFTREDLLTAAGQIAAEMGVASVTLETVAARVGISKGGLQYHFRTKSELMAAVIEHYSREVDLAVENAHSTLPETPGRPLKAYVLGSLEGPIQRDANTAALLAAALEEPALLEPGRKAYRDALRKLREQGINQDLAMVVMCAVDGLMFTEFLQLDPFTAAERGRLVRALLELAETGRVPGKEEQVSRRRVE